MSYWEAVLLGALQGITEFFPVSSSAHLKILRLFFHIDTKTPLFFDLVCHLGSLFSLLWFFKKELFSLLFSPRSWPPYFLALLPLIPAYLFFKQYLPLFSPWFGFFLMVTGTLLFLASYSKEAPSQKRYRDVLYIGLMQSMALFPGLSRSGSTIAAACFRGWEMKKAVEFSFLLAIPTVFGGIILESIQALNENPSLSFTHYALGFFFSFFLGLFAVQQIKRLSKKRLLGFALYCLSMGLFSLVYW